MKAPSNSAVLVLLLTALGVQVAAEEPAALHEQPRLRRPVALAELGGEVFTANRASGSISRVDLTTGGAIQEFPAGVSLSDIAPLPKHRALLALDSATNELLVLRRTDEGLAATARHSLPTAPMQLELAPDASWGAVASRWARQVTLFRVSEGKRGPSIVLESPLNLPFAPHSLWIDAAGERLVVADAFGGRLAQIERETGKVVSQRSLQGSNLRGLATAAEGEELLIAHQLLNEQVSTTHSRVFWGTLLGNVLRSVTFKDLLASPASANAGLVNGDDVRLEQVGIGHWRLYPLGEPDHGTGDPSDVLVTRAGQTLIALAGVNEIALRGAPTQPFVRLTVGRRPTAMLELADGRVLAANEFGDSVSLIDPAEARVLREIPLGPQPELSEAQQGEMLFFDASLSLDGWFSCHSCHTEGHTNSLLADTFGDGSFGYAKRTPSLLGVGETGPWTWRGTQRVLAEQVHNTLASTMQGEEGGTATEENGRLLTAYLETLAPPPGIAHARGRVEQAAVDRGRAVFAKHKCASCHAAPHYTSKEKFDVGIHTPGDDDGLEYNPPSLLGVSQRDRFFHDGRAASLREVFEKHRHPEEREYTAEEIDDLLALLESL